MKIKDKKKMKEEKKILNLILESVFEAVLLSC